MENAQRVWIMYIIVFSFNFLDCRETFYSEAVKVNQHKGILTSKFGSKDMLLWKRGSAFVSTGNESLWIPSRLVWFDGTRFPKRSP